MNWGLLMWGAALLALLLSVAFVVFGIAAVALSLLGVIGPMVGAFSLFWVLIGASGFYLLYEWFVSGV